MIAAVLSAFMCFESGVFAAEGSLSPRSGFTESLEVGSEITYPEEVPESLLSDTENIHFSDEDIYGTGEMCFEDYYIKYFQIITGNESEIANLNAYYAENISEYDTVAEDVLGNVFSDEEAAALAAESEGLEIYKLLVCILTDNRVSDDEKESLKELLSVNSVRSVLDAFMTYKRKVSEGQYEDTDPLAAITENIFRGTVRDTDEYTPQTEQENIISDSENFGDTNEGAVNALAAAVSDKDTILAEAITAPKYYKQDDSNIYIDDKSGNLRYIRRDISIPLSNRTLALDLVYDSSQSIAAKYCIEEIGSGVWSKVSVVNKSSLGVGWRFNITYRDGNIIYLSDGRSVMYDGTSLKNCHYNDISASKTTDHGILITYLDGSTEYLNSSGLMYKSVDKYGNITNYTYSGYKLSKVEADGKEINISYNPTDTVVTLPGGDQIVYEKIDKTITYGPQIYSWTQTYSVLNMIVKLKNNRPRECAYFDYTTYEMETYKGKVAANFSGTDYCVFAVPNEITDVTGYTHNFSYAPTVSKHDHTSTRLWELRVVKKEKGQKIYSTGDYITPSNTVRTDNTKYVETYSSGMIVESEFTPTSNIISTYKVSDNENILVKKETTSFQKDHAHIPDYIETKIYNSNGNYTTYKSVYSYNEKDQPTSVKEYIDNVQKRKPYINIQIGILQ